MPTTAVGRKVVVDRDRGECDVRSEARARLWELNLRFANAAGSHLHAGSAIQRDFSELREVKNGGLQNPVLLPALEVCVFEIPADRLQNINVGLDVQIDLFRNLSRNVHVPRDHRAPCGIAKRVDRHRAIHEERQDTRRRKEQHEPRGETPQLPVLRPSAGRQSAIVYKISLFGNAMT